MHRQKGLAPVLIVLLIALVLGGFLIYQKQTKLPILQNTQPSPATTDETVYTEASRSANPDLIGANWKTYNYDNFGYSFKLPESYVITTNKPTPTEKTTIQSINLNETNASQGSNNFILTVQSGNLSLSLQNLKQNGFTETGTKNINNKEWTVTTSLMETQYLTQVGNKIHTIDGRNISLLEQILSTFKFTP